jgi:hypothetical protein
MIQVGDSMPQIEAPAEFAMAVQRARAMFKTAEMQKAAAFIAGIHRAAIDYIEQAPVLVIAMQAGGGRINGGPQNWRIYAAYKVAQLCEEGAQLKRVMRAYSLPLALRKLKAKSLAMQDEAVLPALAAISPSTLAQIIPNSITAQRAWLGRCAVWIERKDRYGHRRGQDVLPEWAIVQIAKHKPTAGQVHTVADFYTRGDVRLNPAWEWDRAAAAADDWHDRLSAGDAKAKFGVMAEQIVDHGPHPDLKIVDGFEFVALRTPLAIHAEGLAMRHCVSSYVQDVVNGRCSIVSVRKDERRIATMELTAMGIAQLKGRFNARPDDDVRQAARNYTAGLKKKDQAA